MCSMKRHLSLITSEQRRSGDSWDYGIDSNGRGQKRVRNQRFWYHAHDEGSHTAHEVPYGRSRD